MPGIHGHDLVHPHLVNPPEAAISPRALGGGAPGSRPSGRRRECEALDRLVARARSDQSQVLLLRGEAGTGKTALLDYVMRCAVGCRIARIAGAEPEMEMEFAGLHQLCAPFLDRLERLPGPQCDALRTAFSMRDGDAPSRFAVGLATLSLLSQAAQARPLICLVDDAQWLDRASAQALAFVARHLPGAPVAVVFAVRQPDGQQDLTGLPELPVTGLAESDARALLDSVVIGPLDERVRDRIIAETRGNPRALLEVQRGLTPAELAGGFGLPPSGLTLPRRIEESYRRRLAPLPPATRLLLLIAAASRLATRYWYGGRPVTSASRPGRRHPRPRPGSSNSAGRYAFVIRTPGPRSTGRRRHRSARASTALSRRPPTRSCIPISVLGIVLTRHPTWMRTSPPSSSTRPATPAPAEVWLPRPRSVNAPPN